MAYKGIYYLYYGATVIRSIKPVTDSLISAFTCCAVALWVSVKRAQEKSSVQEKGILS